MSARYVPRILGLFVLPALFALPVSAQQEDPANPDIESGLASVEDLLNRDEEVLNDPAIYNYDPGARRDPFKSLVRKSQGKDNLPVGPRPEGIAGLLIDEIELQGIFVLDSGPVVQVAVTSSPTSYLLRPGDQLWDGDVVSISLGEVVFKQTVNDPTALKPFREVVKKLNPSTK